MKLTQNFSQWVDTPPPNRPPADKSCDHPGCQGAPEYRAPKSRQQIVNNKNDWYWFCLDHIRSYNANWNYYQGMNEGQITREQYDDITWQRPTWPLGSGKGENTRPFQSKWHDPFGFFEETVTTPPPQKPFLKEEMAALDLLEIGIPFTKETLKKSYRQLVKKYHPDRNQNNLEAEDMIKRINQAYTLLQKMISN